MEKALVILVMMTLMEEVISCESPILNATVIGGLVLLLVGLWTDFATDTSNNAEDAARPPLGHRARYDSSPIE